MKRLGCLFLFCLLSHAAWAFGEFTINTSDWIDPDKAADTLQAQISVKKIAPDIYQARYVAKRNLSEGDTAGDFARFNTCLANYLAKVNEKPLWQLGFDSNQMKPDKLGHTPDVYFMLMDTRITRYRDLKAYPIIWQNQPPTELVMYQKMCRDYLQDSLAVLISG